MGAIHISSLRGGQRGHQRKDGAELARISWSHQADSAFSLIVIGPT
jgi:hypothetical protein